MTIRIFNVRVSTSFRNLLIAATLLCMMLLISISIFEPIFRASIIQNNIQDEFENIAESKMLRRSKRHILNEIHNETTEHLKYSVNIHHWDFVCGYNVEDLRSHPLFPYSPFRRDNIENLLIKVTAKEFGARVFGFIHPPIDGFFEFGISSDDCSELWLSNNEDPMNSELISYVGGDTGKEWSYLNQFDKYPKQKSFGIKLYAGRKYFFDILWKQERARGHLQVVWKRPFASRFELITSEYISRFYDDSLIENGLVYLDHLKSDIRMPDLPSHVKEFTKQQENLLANRKTPYQRDSAEFLSLTFIEFDEIKKVLTSCEFKPSWLIEPNSEKSKSLGEYGGVYLPHYFNITTKIYPKDQSWDHTSECLGASLKPMHCQGNDEGDTTTATWVTNKYLTALQRRFPNRYKLHTMVNVEQSHDAEKGDRFLLELAIEDFQHQKVRRLSVYLFRPLSTTQLCYPKDFQWRKDAMVHFILTVKNQGSWVIQYIESLTKIYDKTKDTRFNLILIDFESFDVNLEEILKKSSLPHWQLIKKTGNFHKTSAIQDAIDGIKDQNSIALQTDLHLEFPLNFIDDTRKHCVQGKMGYTPLLMRLACGRYSHKPAGFWEAFGYGIFGIYKSDWDHMGGMDVEKFRNAWGGEDWDFGDRVIKSGLEIERLRVPYFFHYFHTKKGMWNNNF